MGFVIRRWLVNLLLGLAVGAATAQTPTTVTVAAASDLQFAIEEVARQFTKRTGQPLRLVFGSSGNFYSQILQGAPFHVYMSADEAFVFKLAQSGKTEGNGRLYAMGRIGIFVPHGSPLKADGQLQDLAQALQDGRLRKFAIASPEHAPYGMRAQEALQHTGIWESVKPALVYGENISQAAQFAASGAAQGGIIAYSLALAPQLASRGHFELIPQGWHQPLAQRMVVLRDAPQAAHDFYNYLLTEQAQAIMVRYGFTLPNN